MATGSHGGMRKQDRESSGDSDDSDERESNTLKPLQKYKYLFDEMTIN